MAEMSLLSSNNYLSELTERPEDLVKAFEGLIDKTAVSYMAENRDRSGCVANLIIGIYSVMHVFRLVLLYTRARELALHHASRAGVYFLEFVLLELHCHAFLMIIAMVISRSLHNPEQ